jgi:hypothetical protein
MPISHVRWLIRRDIQEVLAISPDLQEEDILKCLRQRNCIDMVSEDREEKIQGYMVYELYPKYLEVVYIAANNENAYKSLCDKLFSKLSTHRRRFVHFGIPLCQENLFFLAILKAYGCTSSMGQDDVINLVYSIPIKPSPEELEEIVEVLPE